MGHELLWQQYKVHIDLYKYYLGIIIKFNIFYYAVTGAIISFYFSKVNDENELIKYALIFPALMSVIYSLFFFYSAHKMKVVREDVFSIRDKLHLATAPEVGILTILLNINGTLFFVVSVSLIFLFFLGAQI